MKLVKMRGRSGEDQVGLLEYDMVLPLDLSGGHYDSLSDILEAENPAEAVEFLVDRSASKRALDEVVLLPPIDNQEVWAAGVTYRRSQHARMEESEASASCYDRVYTAPRPELFFKANRHRVVGHGKPVRIRQDSAWNVPEPELTLVLTSHLKLVGFTIGNDMSSRDIEGENPLYLPQAKVYDAACALGPCITLTDWMPKRDEIDITLVVTRGQQVAFRGETNINQMARSFDDLTEYLGRDNTFPNGAFLMTGTGIVPDSDFTLRPGDLIEITIAGIGTLLNGVVQG